MRKYISTHKYGNILPFIQEISFHLTEGKLFPPKYIITNSYKELFNCFYRAFENARIVNNLAIVANNGNFSLLLDIKKYLIKLVIHERRLTN